ncbi:hypothetical protein A2U01_0101006, partial [Trifolium medium]|nr:hypothetical protein [Trifolium medium]
MLVWAQAHGRGAPMSKNTACCVGRRLMGALMSRSTACCARRRLMGAGRAYELDR